MTKRAKAHLRKYKEQDKYHFLQALLRAYIEEPESLDVRISMLGEMRRLEWRENQIGPYLEDWRPDSEVWIQRCLERLTQNFRGDLHALPCLLSFSLSDVVGETRKRLPHLIHAASWKSGPYSRPAGEPYLRATLAESWNGPGSDSNSAHRCLELSWMEDCDWIVECHYIKVIRGAGLTSYLHGNCRRVYVTSAHDSGGFWHSANDKVELGEHEDVAQAVAQLPAFFKGE